MSGAALLGLTDAVEGRRTGPAVGRPSDLADGRSPRTEEAAWPTTLQLPDGFRPEGIAIGGGPWAYFGSIGDGSIYRVDLRSGAGAVISEGPGTASLGLKLDRWGRLFVAGQRTGEARVVDSRSGALLATYRLTEGTSFVNDVVLTPSAAWFTDSYQPVLYGLPLGQDGRLPDPADVVRLPLAGEWQQVPGEVINANGIAPTPDGRALLVVQSGVGLLHRVNPTDGVAVRVDLGAAAPLTNGDGLLLEGRTLYVVQNRQNAVDVFRLDATGGRGEFLTRITDPRFDVPTTAAAYGDRIYLPNARFTTPPTPQTTYTAVAVERVR
ncbi:SMP-30/gluconolactonase/LRE family protein [Streptomyces sp. SAJ15]|uniref:SMP-30/gluconolactonase/LRE family protein n=1 Tax=Streptomyces sp. SAJ15 TaxID=2011095 RepID=UPI0021B2CF83|nr:superoxide dismutase [Streptomyces sp. SAJ15]